MPDEEMKEAPPAKVQGNPAVVAEKPEELDTTNTVTMFLPKRVTVNLGHSMITFEAGVQEVPANVADHWYLKANGAKRYDANKSKPAAAGGDSQITDRHARFLKAKGYVVETLQSAKDFYNSLETDALKAGFLRDAAEWKEPDAVLAKMTKAQLADHTFDEHGVILESEKMTRDEMIAEIEKLRAEKKPAA